MAYHFKNILGEKLGGVLLFLGRALMSAFVLGWVLYANLLYAQVTKPTNQAQSWQNTSQWLYGALTSSFAKSADNYQSAMSSMKGVAEESKQYSAFEYSYDLAITAVQPERANEIAREWVSAYPQDLDARLALIRALLMQNKVEESYREMVIILNTDAGPQNIAQITRLLIYLQDGNDRVRLLKKLSDTYTNNPYLYYYLGVTAKEQGQVDLAIASFNHALMLDKHWRELELMQAKTLSDVGELKEARQMMAKLRKRYPKDTSLLSTEIDMLVDHYQWQDALTLARLWDKLNPGDERIQELIAWLFANSGDFADADVAYTYLLDNDNIEKEQFLLQTAQAAQNAGNYLEAEKRLTEIPKDSRLYMMAHQQLALMALKQGEIPKAQAEFAKLRKELPEYALEMYLLEVSRLDQIGEYKKADSIIAEALAQYPEQVDVLYAQAQHLQSSGYPEQAEKMYQHILTIDSANIDALNAYGYLLLTQTNQQEEATKLIEQAIKQYPDSPVIQDSYAWLLYHQGKTQEALSWLQRAYAAYRKDEISAHYVEILSVLGKKNLAKEIYTYERYGQPDNAYLLETGKRLGFEKHNP